MEILILLGIGIVIFLLVRRPAPALPAPEASNTPAERPPAPAPGRFRYEAAPKREVLITIPQALERDPDPSPLAVADYIDTALRSTFGSSLPLETRMNHGKFILAVYLHATMLAFEHAEGGQKGLLIDEVVNSAVRALQALGVVPEKRKKLAARAVENILKEQVELAIRDGEVNFVAKRRRVGLLIDSMEADGTAPLL